MDDIEVLRELERSAREGRTWLYVARRRSGDGKGERSANRTTDGPLLETLAGLPGVFVARGTVRGAELELCLAATLVVAHPKASFLGGEGTPPLYHGSLHRLRGRLGAGGSLAFWLDGKAWSARRAHRRGLVDAVDASPEARASSWRALWDSQPGATEKLRLLLGARRGVPERGALALERALFSLGFAGDGPRRGAEGFFE